MPLRRVGKRLPRGSLVLYGRWDGSVVCDGEERPRLAVAAVRPEAETVPLMPIGRRQVEESKLLREGRWLSLRLDNGTGAYSDARSK